MSTKAIIYESKQFVNSYFHIFFENPILNLVHFFKRNKFKQIISIFLHFLLLYDTILYIIEQYISKTRFIEVLI